MKKILVYILVLVMIFSAVGCDELFGKGDTPAASTTTTAATTTVGADSTTAGDTEETTTVAGGETDKTDKTDKMTASTADSSSKTDKTTAKKPTATTKKPTVPQVPTTKPTASATTTKPPVPTANPNATTVAPPVQDPPPAQSQTHTPLTLSQYYQYANMNAKQQRIYKKIRDAADALTEEVVISSENVTVKEARAIFERFRADHPHYFWVAPKFAYSSFDIKNGDNAIVYACIMLYTDGTTTDALDDPTTDAIDEKVTASRSTIATRRATFATKTAEIVATVPTTATAAQKEKLIHDYLVKNLSYDTAAAENAYLADGTLKPAFDAYGALVNKTAVCEGYTELFQTLLLMVGVNANRIDGNNHTWNTVLLDGDWYEVDVTWDDPIYVGGYQPNTVSYEYFNLTSAKMAEKHSAKGVVVDENSPLLRPTCTATKYAPT